MQRWIAALALLFVAAAPSERERAEHALNRLSFGARPGDLERVTRIGVDRWIDEQLHPERIDDRVVAARVARYEKVVEIPSRDDKQKARRAGRKAVADVSAQRILRAAESERQLNEVMVDFWMNHFNVFAAKGLDRYLVGSYEREAIRPRVWGRFEDLLMATAKSPAMLFYLDNFRSRSGALNENYARELMELHTIGVDAGYTQKDVTELARVFTGWSIDKSGAFRFRRFAHDDAAKTVLGVRMQGGMDEGERMIRFLARHPSTAKHIATKLCIRLVSDEPSPALVERVAKRFRDTNGDLRATVKAVLDSPEFWSSRGAKVKSPFEYAVSAIRAAGGTIDDPLPLARELRKMGEGLYLAQPPTGYPDDAESWSGSGATLARLDFVLALVHNKMPGVRVRAGDADALARTLGGKEFTRQ
ncbi:MAG TPA: DUF1800 domain-containing protein [Thermoanaerobaculia bacterium]|jgi:uncharacterized protein (DUF1800 family)|nr:DUF1800 domain-containing protein [Thermoanaerobaculia bacterium]